MKIFIFLFLAFTRLCLTIEAQAGEPDARDLYRQGNELFDQEKFKEAAQTFRRAYDLKPHWKIKFNIGQAEAAAKRYGLALEQFEAYLVEAGDEVTVEREKLVTGEIQKLKTKVGSLNIDAPEGAIVRIGGEKRGVAPLLGKLRVNAGVTHKLEIELGGEILMSREFRLGSGEIIDIQVTEDDEDDGAVVESVPQEDTRDDAVQASDASVPPPKSGKKLAIAGWSLLGVGGAALIAGGITGAMAISKNNELKESDSCDESSNTCHPEMKNDGSSVTTMGMLSTVFFSAGAALAATGVVLLIVNRKKRESVIAAAPVVSPMFSGLVLEGRF